MSSSTRRLTVRLVLGALLATLALPPAGAKVPPPARKGAVELRGINHITGTRSGSVDVYLPETATLDARVRWRRRGGPSPDVSIEGRGRVVGVALVESPPRVGRAYYFAGRFLECSKRACDSPFAPHNFIQAHGGGARVKLPAGNYRLHLITDGSEAKVSLRIPSLKGVRHVHPTQRLAAQILSPEVQLTTETGTVTSWRAEMNTPHDAFILRGFWAKTAAYFGHRMAECGYLGGSPAPEPVQHGPGLCDVYWTTVDDLDTGLDLPTSELVYGCAYQPGVYSGEPASFGCQDLAMTGRKMTLDYGGYVATPSVVERFGITAVIFSVR